MGFEKKQQSVLVPAGRPHHSEPSSLRDSHSSTTYLACQLAGRGLCRKAEGFSRPMQLFEAFQLQTVTFCYARTAVEPLFPQILYSLCSLEFCTLSFDNAVCDVSMLRSAVSAPELLHSLNRKSLIAALLPAGGQVYYHGGLDANDPTRPLTDPMLEMVDLDTMMPYVLPVSADSRKSSTRYNHVLATWDDNLVMLGGQVDDHNGQSKQVLDVLLMDPNDRRWILKRKFTQQTQGKSG